MQASDVESAGGADRRPVELLRRGVGGVLAGEADPGP